MGVHPKFGYSGYVLAPSSFTNPLNLPIKKRFRKPQDSSPTKTKRLRFATVREEEDYYYQKIQELSRKNRQLCSLEDPLATKKSTKKRPRVSTDQEVEKQKRKIPKKMKHVPVVKNEVTEKLERCISGEMNGLDAKLVIQKILYPSDLKRDQNRLNMPIKQLKTQDFLTPEEKKDLEDRKNIEVQLVGPRLQMYKKPMVLRAWSMARTKNYVLNTNWNKFVKDNNTYLKENSKIQVWSFRKDPQLCFALVVVDRPDSSCALPLLLWTDPIL